MSRTTILTLMICLAGAATNARAQVSAQARAIPGECTDACTDVKDDKGFVVGHGCIGGTAGLGCIATRYSCELAVHCWTGSIWGPNGALLKVGSMCDLADAFPVHEVAKRERREVAG